MRFLAALEMTVVASLYDGKIERFEKSEKRRQIIISTPGLKAGVTAKTTLNPARAGFNLEQFELLEQFEPLEQPLNNF
jgi:hypothetical protein